MTRRMATPSPQTPPGSTPRYLDRVWDDPRHDPYEPKGKYAEPTVCPGCHAVYRHGRWTWAPAPEGARAVECPACHRIRDRQPAGYVTLAGALVEGDRDALVRLVRKVEKHENTEHPLHRIIDVEQEAGEVRLTTTDVHLPQRIGEAVKRAHRGQLEVKYGHDDYVVRVHWRSA